MLLCTFLKSFYVLKTLEQQQKSSDSSDNTLLVLSCAWRLSLVDCQVIVCLCLCYPFTTLTMDKNERKERKQLRVAGSVG